MVMGLDITSKKGSCKLAAQTNWLDQILRHAQCRSQENACDLERSLQSPPHLHRQGQSVFLEPLSWSLLGFLCVIGGLETLSGWQPSAPGGDYF